MSIESSGPAWFRALSHARIVAGSPAEASAVCHDSRAVTAGAVFVAIPGFATDGNRFIPDAVTRGAGAVIVQEDARSAWAPHAGGGPTFVAVPDARAALAEAASALAGHPARALGMVGVTGTDGKTTTTHIIAHVLRATGRPAAHLSSAEFSIGGAVELNASHMTTLEASEIQARLARARDAGDRYAVVEASSIGLALHRVDRCEFDVGVFTNLAPDHLDFHRTMEAYAAAKAALFEMVAASTTKPGVAKAAVINSDDAAAGHMRQAAGAVPVLTYGMARPADVSAHDITSDGAGMQFAVRSGGEAVVARTPLVGEYNVANCLAAVAVAISQGVALRHAAAALASFGGVPGRMQIIDEGQPFRVVVDIASTEQAMANVLRVLRPVTPGNIIVVFGAAGERDTERRGGIARAVAAGADFAVVTNEDPRTEDAGAIIAEIGAALTIFGFDEGRQFQRVPDRRQAMGVAFARAKPSDTVLLAGKGNEQSIVIGTTHHPWDEREVARELLRGPTGRV